MDYIANRKRAFAPVTLNQVLYICSWPTRSCITEDPDWVGSGAGVNLPTRHIGDNTARRNTILEKLHTWAYGLEQASSRESLMNIYTMAMRSTSKTKQLAQRPQI